MGVGADMESVPRQKLTYSCGKHLVLKFDLWEVNLILFNCVGNKIRLRQPEVTKRKIFRIGDIDNISPY